MRFFFKNWHRIIFYTFFLISWFLIFKNSNRSNQLEISELQKFASYSIWLFITLVLIISDLKSIKDNDEYGQKFRGDFIVFIKIMIVCSILGIVGVYIEERFNLLNSASKLLNGIGISIIFITIIPILGVLISQIVMSFNYIFPKNNFELYIERLFKFFMIGLYFLSAYIIFLLLYHL
jgi:hypothetical protein